MTKTLNIKVKRVYALPEENDGLRILVDRLWPRGLKKADAHIDVWAKELAPSPRLRMWFGHEEPKFPEFRKRYLQELTDRHEEVQTVLMRAVFRPVTLLYAARNPTCNHALILREYLLVQINSLAISD
jgi:uncharacterized protein YeaO (DUF488 family)